MSCAQSARYKDISSLSTQGEPRDKFVLGGLHMTDPAYLITYMIKELTATESRGFISDEFLADIGDGLDLEDLYVEQDNIYNLGEAKSVFFVEVILLFILL